MTDEYMSSLLVDFNFYKIETKTEPHESFNSIIRAYRKLRRLTREEGVKAELFGE